MRVGPLLRSHELHGLGPEMVRRQRAPNHVRRAAKAEGAGALIAIAHQEVLGVLPELPRRWEVPVGALMDCWEVVGHHGVVATGAPQQHCASMLVAEGVGVLPHVAWRWFQEKFNPI